MITYHSSDNASVSTVVVPELSDLLKAPLVTDYALAEAFTYADPSKFRQILLMKRLLSEIFEGDIPEYCTPEKYVAAYERLSKIITSDLPDTVTTIFPGAVSLPPVLNYEKWNETLTERLAALDGAITFSLKRKTDCDLLRAVADCHKIGFQHISMIVNRACTEDSARLLPRLTKIGRSVTICGDTSLMTAMPVLGFNTCDNVCIFDGHILIPGMTVLRRVPSFPASTENYSAVKSVVTDMADAEMRRLFSHSAKGKPYYKPTSESVLPFEWSIFYPNCLGSREDPRIRGILTGGAVYDCLSVAPELSEVRADDYESMERALRFTVTACKSLESRYPLKMVPHFKDTRTVSNKDELIEAVRSHLRIFGKLWGNFSLCISIAEGFVYPSVVELSSILKGFFGLGGLMITFLFEGDSK